MYSGLQIPSIRLPGNWWSNAGWDLELSWSFHCFVPFQNVNCLIQNVLRRICGSAKLLHFECYKNSHIRNVDMYPTIHSASWQSWVNVCNLVVVLIIFQSDFWSCMQIPHPFQLPMLCSAYSGLECSDLSISPISLGCWSGSVSLLGFHI